MKGVNFFGPRSEFIVSGSDCGNIYFWDKNTEAIVQWMRGDEEGVVCTRLVDLYVAEQIRLEITLNRQAVRLVALIALIIC